MKGKVTCPSCGHSWNKSDSSQKDMHVCHMCGKSDVDISKAQEGTQVLNSRQKKGIELQIQELKKEEQDQKELRTTGTIKHPKSIAFKDKQKELAKKQTYVTQDNRSEAVKKYDEEKGKAKEAKKQFKKNILAPLDVATDVMQLGNFVPHPYAQAIGEIGNLTGAAIDAYQAADDYSEGDYGSAAINAGSLLLPMALGTSEFRRNSKYLRPGQPLYPFSPQANLPAGTVNIPRVQYIEPFTKVKGMTDKNLLTNRALLGTLGAETYMDVPKQKNGGWLDAYNDDVPQAQNGIEGTMAGLTDKGFNYNSAWGGQFQDGGYVMGTYFDEDIREKEPSIVDETYDDYNTAMRGMMKSKMATQAALGNKGAQRMMSYIPPTYTFTGEERFSDGEYAGVPAGKTGTHYISDIDNYVYPNIQDRGDGTLFFKSDASPYDREAMRFESQPDAEYFANHYKEVAPMMRSFDKMQNGGILNLFKGKFAKFKETLPPNLRNTPNRDYDMRYLWKHSGKPKDLAEYQGWAPGTTWEQQLPIDTEAIKAGTYNPSQGFALVKDVDDETGEVSYNYHGNTVEPNTGRFLKPKHHSTLYMELDNWYNGTDPDMVEFRKTHELKDLGKYYQYVPKTQMAMGGSLPGAVGFTYARTQDIPSEGPYAKKTMPSAQNGVDMYGAPITAKENHRYDVNRTYYDPRTNTMIFGADYAASDKKDKIKAHENYHAKQHKEDRDNFDIGHNTQNRQWAEMQKRPELMSTDAVWNNFYNRKPIESDMMINRIAERLPESQFFRNAAGDIIYNKIVDSEQYKVPYSLEGEAQHYEDTGTEFQNGGEMKYYQEGLDWKPKTISQNGKKIKIKDERGQAMKSSESTGVKRKNFDLEQSKENKAYYNAVAAQKKEAARRAKLTKEQREREDYNAYNEEHGSIKKYVPETNWQRTKAVVSNPMTAAGYIARGERLPGRFQFGPRNEYDYAVDWINPLQGAVALSEIPGELRRGEFMNAGLSALDALDLGVYAKGARAAAKPLIRKGVQQLGNIKTSVAPELRQGLQTNGLNIPIIDEMGDAVKFISEKFDRSNLESPSGNQWLKDWYADDIIKERLLKFSPKGKLDKLSNQKYLSQEDFENLQNLRSMQKYHSDAMTSNPFYNDPNIYDFKEKNYTDLLKEQGLTDYLKHVLTTGGVNYGGSPEHIYHNRLMYYPFDKKGLESIKVHEGTHAVNNGGDMFGSEEVEELLKPFGESLTTRSSGYSKPSLFNMKPYYTSPTEIHARMNQSRFENNLKPKDIFTEDHFNSSMQKNKFNGMGKYIKDKDAFIKLMNNFYTPAAVIGLGGAGAASQLEQKREGGVIKDDRGQWDHPGEITEIGSNDITMQGVPYPVLGISDEGDVKLMKPGGKYKYKGKKVTEFPIAKNGVNQQDQKTLQHIDQLTNFTNYNKPSGWMDKYE